MINERVRQWAIALAARSMRERALILLSGIVIIGWLLFFWGIEPALLKSGQQHKQLAQTLLTLQQTEQSIEQNKRVLAQDPNQRLREQLERVQQQIATTDASLKRGMVSLIPADQMTKALEQLLGQVGRLQLVSLRSLPVLPVELPKDVSLNLYRQGIEVTFRGSYFDIYHYLRALTGLHGTFFWERFNYRVLEYPEAQVILELYTISTNKDFIRG